MSSSIVGSSGGVQSRSASRNAPQVAALAGAIVAMRFPPRVITVVSPRSARSRTAENDRDASDAVITRIDSDYLNSWRRAREAARLQQRNGGPLRPARSAARGD